MGNPWDIRLWKTQELIDEIKWSIILYVCCFTCWVPSHALYLMWCSKPPCETQTAVWPQRAVWSSRKSEDLHKVRTQKFWLLTSHMATCGESPIAQVHHGFMPSHEKNRESKKCLRLGLPPHEPLPRYLWFLRETVSSHWCHQRSGTWDLREKAGRVTLGEIRWNRQDLTCQCAAFPSPPGSALMLRTERKEWRAGAHFSQSL